jgi:hypothetical protein
MADEDAVSHVDSEQGDVPQTELEDMRKRIRRGEMDTKRMLRWIDEAANAGQPEEEVVVEVEGQKQKQQQQQQQQQRRRRRPDDEEELGFVGGKRGLQHEGEVPYGRVCPALAARIEVEFQDAIYCGTVTGRRGTTVCTVKFDADSEEVDIRCGQHRFREIPRGEPETNTAGERSDEALTSGKVPSAADEPRCTPLKRKRGTGTTAALSTSEPAAAPAASSEDSPGAAKGSPDLTRSTQSGSAATAESSAPQSSGGFAVSTSPAADEETGHVELSQATAELVGGVTNDLDASLAQIGMFLEADCAQKEGKSS